MFKILFFKLLIAQASFSDETDRFVVCIYSYEMYSYTYPLVNFDDRVLEAPPSFSKIHDHNLGLAFLLYFIILYFVLHINVLFFYSMYTLYRESSGESNVNMTTLGDPQLTKAGWLLVTHKVQARDGSREH